MSEVNAPDRSRPDRPRPDRSRPDRPRIEIRYCWQCRWLLRAAWLAQELLTTFDNQLGEVALVPGEGGAFEIRCDGKILFTRQSESRFPEAKEVKQWVRDIVDPERELGHSDRGRDRPTDHIPHTNPQNTQSQQEES